MRTTMARDAPPPIGQTARDHPSRGVTPALSAKGWADLRPYFNAGEGRVGGWSFEEYQGRVAIRWDVDPAKLELAAKQNPRPTFPIISASSPFSGMIAEHEPNEIVYRYLRQRPRRHQPQPGP